MPNFVIIENVKSKPKRKTIIRRNMKDFDNDKFQTDLNNNILKEITRFEDTETAFTFFHKKHLEILNTHAPFKTLTKKEQELEKKNLDYQRYSHFN